MKVDAAFYKLIQKDSLIIFTWYNLSPMVVRGQRVRKLRHQWNCHWLKNQSGKSEYLPRTLSCFLPAALSIEANLVRCRSVQFHYNLCCKLPVKSWKKLPCRPLVSTYTCVFPSLSASLSGKVSKHFQAWTLFLITGGHPIWFLGDWSGFFPTQTRRRC